MSFYTSLTGLNAATSQLAVTSNNIANVGTTGFKRSRADFGDIFATSPLQKASSVIGQGVALKQVSQEFSQGNIQFSANSLDIAITGDGFFPLKSADGLQDIFTRNGTFMLNDSYNVVNSAGQALIAAGVDSSGKADLGNLSKLLIPRKTSGDAVATSQIQLGLNFPSDATVPALPFDRNDPNTYNKTTAVTVYDSGGNDYLATVYYRKTQVATAADPSNKWQTYVYIGDTKLQELLIQSTDKNSEKQYVNKYGQIRSESQIPPQDIARGVTKLFNMDDLKNPVQSSAASASGGALLPSLTNEWKNSITFPDKIDSLLQSGTADVLTYPVGTGAASYTFNDGIAPPYTASNLSDLVTAINGDVANPHDYTVAMNGTGDQLTVNVKDKKTITPPTLTSIPATDVVFDNVTYAPAATTTQGTDPVNQKASVSFPTLQAGDSVTMAGLTFTATGTVTGADVAKAFSGLAAGTTAAAATTAALAANSALAGSFTAGPLTDWATDTATSSGAALDFTSAIAGAVTNPTPTETAAITAPSVTTSSVTGVNALNTITFPTLAAGDSVTIAGLTFTATGAVSSTELADAFSGLADPTTAANATTAALAFNSGLQGSFTAGSLVGWASPAPGGLSTVQFTATAQDTSTIAATASAGVTLAAPNVDTAGVVPVNEVDSFTFKDMAAGDTVTLGGLTFTATGDVTAADVAKAFSGLTEGTIATDANTAALAANSALAGSFTGTLTDWSTATTTTATLAFIGKDPSITALSAARTLPTITATSTPDVVGVVETSQLSFKDMKAGDTVTIGGLSFTATADMTGAQIADMFTNLADGTTADDANLAHTSPDGHFVSGTALTGWSSAPAASGVKVDFTSTTAANVTDISSTFARPGVESIVDFVSVEGAMHYTFNDGTTTFTGTNLKDLAATITKSNATHIGYTVSYNTVSSSLEVTRTDPTQPAPTLSASFDPNADIKFNLNVDGSSKDVTIDLNYLHSLAAKKSFTGVEIAREITNVINKAYGDDKYFDFSTLTSPTTPNQADLFKISVNNGTEHTISLTQSPDPASGDVLDLKTITIDDAVKAMQKKVNAAFNQPGDPEITVGYSALKGSFTFTSSNGDAISLDSATNSNNALFGLTTAKTAVDPTTGTYGTTVLPNGATILDPADQRYGINVTFDDTNNKFTISSGSSGDTSSIKISDASAMAKALFGFPIGTDGVSTTASTTPIRGIPSQPAVVTGTTIGINLDNKFRVDGSNNQFVVTVDNVTGLVEMPPRADYTIEEFRTELEKRINSLADNFGRTVSGVKVNVVTDPGTNNKHFSFTTGTTGDNSFLKVSANSIWGLANTSSARGTTSLWMEPKQAMNADGFPLYVDRNGLETSDPGAFSEDETRELWSPIYLSKGELTFDSAGNLQSPKTATDFKSTTIGNSGATIKFAIDYGSSTQYSSPFSVQKQNQNGRPEGDLVGVDIADNGLVSASYSNGNQKSLAKIILVNFASPTGLRQIGDSSYYSTSKSGDAKYGEAGAAGFGTVRAGARERANVDLTTELVELITAQRNFQANAKAIETNNTLTQAIINIRS